MNLFVFLAAIAAASAQNPAQPPATVLSGVKTVYMLPMSGGLDQYLAVKLTARHIFQVVTDPLKADAVFTDRIGHGFEQQLRDLFAAEKPPDNDKSTDDFVAPSMAPLARSRGSIFLVDHKTHNVIWSAYFPHKNNDAFELNKLANKVADQLDRDLHPSN